MLSPAILSQNAAATSGSLTLLTMQNQTGTTAVDLGGSVWEITKTAADGDWGNASATSVQSFAGDFILRFTPQQADKECMVGVTTDPLASNHYNTIDYAIYFNNAGQVSQLYENNVANTVSATNYAAGDNFFIKRTGSTMSIGYGGTDGVSGYTEKWARTTSATLYVDSAIVSIGAKFRVTRLA